MKCIMITKKCIPITEKCILITRKCIQMTEKCILITKKCIQMTEKYILMTWEKVQENVRINLGIGVLVVVFHIFRFSQTKNL